MDESIHQVTSHEESVKLLGWYSRPALPLSVFNRPISCLPTPKPEEPANDAASTWWLNPTLSRPNGVTTTGGRPPRPHLTHLTSNPFPHLISPFHFSFIAFPIVCSTETISMDIWLRFECLLSLCCSTSSIC